VLDAAIVTGHQEHRCSLVVWLAWLSANTKGQDFPSNHADLLLQLLVATSVMARLWSTFLKGPPQLGSEVELQHA